MSRDLTCNESLADDVNNFSPNQSSRFNQAQQLLSSNSVQSLALLRDQVLQQQQLQNQQSNQLAVNLLRAQQALGSNIDQLGSSLASSSAPIADNTLLAQLQLLQQQNQQQRQTQLLDRLQSSALLAQTNLYGAVPSQLPSSASGLNNLGLQSSNVDQQQASRLNHLQQLATALGIQIPVNQAQNVNVQSDKNESIVNQLLQQVQAQQQLQTSSPVLANTQTLQQGNLTQTASRTSSIEQQLISRILNSSRPLNIGSTSSAQPTQMMVSNQISELLQTPQLLQIARELTEQHSAQPQQSQQPSFAAKQELRQTGSYPDTNQRQQSELVKQYLQRVAAQCGVTLSTDSQYSNQQTTSQASQSTSVPAQSTSISASLQQLQQQLPYEQQQLLQQHLNNNAQLLGRQSFVSQANNYLNNLQNAYLLQQEARTSQQLQPDQQQSLQTSANRTAVSSPRILKRSRPSSSTSATTSNLQQRPITDYSIEELKQKQLDLLKNSLHQETPSSPQQQEQIMEEYRTLQRIINSKILQSHDRNGSGTSATQAERSRVNEDQAQQDKLASATNPYRHNLDQLHGAKEQTTSAQPHSQQNPNDSRHITNIPTLAAFRQVPGQEIFDHLPKKRLKQDKLVEKDIVPASAAGQRKQAKSSESHPSSQSKKSPQKGVYVVKKHNGSSNLNAALNHESAITENDDTDNLLQRYPGSALTPQRKRGRPRTAANNKSVGSKSSSNLAESLINLDASPTRTILHDAVDIFLKPAAPEIAADRATVSPDAVARKRIKRKSKSTGYEQILSKIDTLAAAVNMTSPQDSDLISPADSNLLQNRLKTPENEQASNVRRKKAKARFNPKSSCSQQAIKKLKEKHPELAEMPDLEVCGVEVIMEALSNEQNASQAELQKNKSLMANFLANSLQSGPDFWNILHRIPKKMLPYELNIVDNVFNQQHLLDLAKVEILTKYLTERNGAKSKRSRPLFKNFVDENERKNIQLMAMHLSFAQRRMDFVKNFIYESTMVRLLNNDYKELRGDRFPQELFIEEPSVYKRINKQFGQMPPENSKFMNCAEVECKLLNQMYRYRTQFFNEVHNRPFAATFKKRLTPDEMIILNMDVTKTLFNVVDAVSDGKPYVSFAQENQLFLNNTYPVVENFRRMAFKTCEPIKKSNSATANSIHEPNARRTVILKAKQTTNEVDELKQRLQTHLTNNFNELLQVHDTAYKIRCHAIELHRKDINQMLTSMQRSAQNNLGRRCASVEPPINMPPTLPLYIRRRCRSLDIGVRSRVVNSVGVRYLRYSLALSDVSTITDTNVNDESAKQPDLVEANQSDNEAIEFGPKEYHEVWQDNNLSCLSDRFKALLNERQQLIAALIKLTLIDKNSRVIIDAANERNVAVSTDEFKINDQRSRKHKLKSSIAIAKYVKRLPHLQRLQLSRRFKKQRTKLISRMCKVKQKDFNWWHSQMLTGNLNSLSTSQTVRTDSSTKLEKQKLQWLKERYKFVAMCKRIKTDGAIPYTPSLYIRDKNFIIETLSERGFNNELNFRHLKCAALKFYAILDPERHEQFVKKLEKLEAPRLDVVLKMRNDFTIGYLYELPKYELKLRSHTQQKYNGRNSIKITPNPDAFDDMFGGKEKNPYRQPLLFPVTTSPLEINSAQLTKYRNRELDSTSAERLHNHINLTMCAYALMRLIYQSPKYGDELAIFMSHPAFKIFDSEQGDQNGFPSTVYQVAIAKAVEGKKLPVESRKMPEFKNNDEAEQYFKERQRSLKEKLASVLTIAQKNTVLSRRCIKTMKKLSGVEKSQNAKITLLRQHYNSLSSRSKSQFAKRYRMELFNENTKFDSTVRPEDNLKAPLVIPGFNPLDSNKSENSLKLPSYVRNDILTPPRVQLSTSDDLRASMRGGKISRGRGSRRLRRAGKY